MRIRGVISLDKNNKHGGRLVKNKINIQINSKLIQSIVVIIKPATNIKLFTRYTYFKIICTHCQSIFTMYCVLSLCKCWTGKRKQTAFKLKELPKYSIYLNEITTYSLLRYDNDICIPIPNNSTEFNQCICKI